MKISSYLVPWRAKIALKILLSRLPLGYSLWQKIGIFRHGRMDQDAYSIGVFSSHCERSALISNLRNKVILELGPGDSISTAIIAASYGASSILIDSGDFVSQDLNRYLSLEKSLRDLNLNPPDLSDCKNILDILAVCNSVYYTKSLASLEKIKPESVDLIFSQAVLEHIQHHEFFKTMCECKRILKNDGLASHRVDLKDHLGGSLNNLRFSHKIWESNLFAKSGFYTNRIRYSKMIELFETSGFVIVKSRLDRWEAIPISRKKLAPGFQSLSDDDLMIKGFDILLR